MVEIAGEQLGLGEHGRAQPGGIAGPGQGLSERDGMTAHGKQPSGQSHPCEKIHHGPARCSNQAPVHSPSKLASDSFGAPSGEKAKPLAVRSAVATSYKPTHPRSSEPPAITSAAIWSSAPRETSKRPMSRGSESRTGDRLRRLREHLAYLGLATASEHLAAELVERRSR